MVQLSAGSSATDTRCQDDLCVCMPTVLSRSGLLGFDCAPITRCWITSDLHTCSAQWAHLSVCCLVSRSAAGRMHTSVNKSPVTSANATRVARSMARGSAAVRDRADANAMRLSTPNFVTNTSVSCLLPSALESSLCSSRERGAATTSHALSVLHHCPLTKKKPPPTGCYLTVALTSDRYNKTTPRASDKLSHTVWSG